MRGRSTLPSALLGILALASAGFATEPIPRLAADAAGRLVPAGAVGVRPFEPPPRGAARSVVAAGAGWLLAGARVESGDRTELWIARGDERGWHDVQPPAERTGALRQGPLLLASGGRPAGLAWLEGDAHDRLAVRWAPWRGDGFGDALTLAPPGPGSQLALAGAVLPGGRRLIVWAGYDGRDDEIWAVIGGPDGWSAPRRVDADDEAPDVTPAVAVAGAGALVTWSSFDGSEYRVVLAEFDGERFGAPRDAAPPGSIDPTFERGADGQLLLLHFDARSDAWVASRLDERGRARGVARLAARVADDGETRPRVAATPRGARWTLPGREVETAWE